MKQNTMTPTELRELDAWIAEHLFGLKANIRLLGSTETAIGFTTNPYFLEGGHEIEAIKQYCAAPNYTTDPAAAMMVLERCYEKSPQLSFCTCKSPYGYKFWLPNNYSIALNAETIPLAICQFAKNLFEKGTK